MGDFRCKSTFCVINNPEYTITYKHNEAGEIIKDENGKPEILTKEPTQYFGLTPQQICDDILNKWISDGENHTGAVLYCISAVGLEHLHCVFESDKAYRPLSVLKRLYPKIHIEPTKGSKKDVEDYINKVGKYEEKGEKIIAKSQQGEIKGCQGKRTDLISLDDISLLIENGSTPRQIFKKYPKSLKEQKAVEWLFYNHRAENTPPIRDVKVTWLFGSTGCGKSYTYVDLCKKHGEDNVYIVSDYDHPFDMYNGEPVIMFDEFRGQIRYSNLLCILDKYKQQVSARYANKMMLWSDVYITSPFLPCELYQNTRERYADFDSLNQLLRRINNLLYCFKYTYDDMTVYAKYKLDIVYDMDSRLTREECTRIRYDYVHSDFLPLSDERFECSLIENRTKEKEVNQIN